MKGWGVGWGGAGGVEGQIDLPPLLPQEKLSSKSPALLGLSQNTLNSKNFMTEPLTTVGVFQFHI